MPFVTVLGVPESYPQDRLDVFCECLCGTLMLRLGLQRKDISPFCPRDRFHNRPDGEILIVIEMFEKAERTDALKNELAELVGGAVARKFFPEALVECRIKTFDPKTGFWSSAG